MGGEAEPELSAEPGSVRWIGVWRRRAGHDIGGVYHRAKDGADVDVLWAHAEHRVQLFFPDEIDTVIGSYTKQPGAESVIRLILVQFFKCFGKGLNGKVHGVLLIVNHFERHKVDGIFIPVHQVGVCLLVSLACFDNKVKIIFCVFGKICVYFHCVVFIKVPINPKIFK